MRSTRSLLVLGLMIGFHPMAQAEEKTSDPPAVIDARFEDGTPVRITTSLDELIGRTTLTPEQDVVVVPVGRDEHSSHHTVAIRGAETLHRHDRHDLMVIILRGHGSMQLGEERRAVGEGSILYIPRGTPHAFANTSSAPAVAYTVYHPPYDGRDRIEVD